MFAALGKVAVGAVKGKAKKIAADKLLNRKKKTDARRAKAQEVMGVGPEKGGAMVKAPSNALTNIPLADSVSAISKSSSGGGGGSDDTAEGVALKIKTTVIQVEKLLAGSVAVQKKQLQAQKDAQEDAEFAKEEGDLEKKLPKQSKSKFNIPVPGKGMLATVVGFITNVAFGFIIVKLMDFLPKLQGILPKIGEFVDGVFDIAGKVLNIFATVIDFGYKLVDGLGGLVTNVFGEEGAKKFETFMTNLKDLIQGFLIWKLLGEKIFKAVLRSVTRAFRIARVIIKRSLRFAKKFLSNIGKQLLKIPGVKNVVGKIGQIGGNILSKGASVGGNILSKAGGIASKGAGAVVGKVGGFAAKIFGPAAKVVAPAMKAAMPAVKGFAKRIPILGPIIVAVVSLMSGEPIGQALFKAVGAGLGGALGTFIPIPILGTLIGETVGVFVGDLMYELIMGGGIEAVGKKLKDTFKTFIEPVFNFFKDGIGRFFTNFPTIDIPSGFGAQTALGKLFPFLADSKGLVTKFPDPSLLIPGIGTLKLIKHMGASFMPGIFGESSGGESSPPPKVESDTESKPEVDVKGQGNKSITNNPNRGGGDVLDRESGAIVTKPKEVKLSSTQSNNRSDMVDSVSDFTTYEESDGGNEILLAPSSSTGGKTKGGNQVVKEKIVQISVDTSDPYEVLYRG